MLWNLNPRKSGIGEGRGPSAELDRAPRPLSYCGESRMN